MDHLGAGHLFVVHGRLEAVMCDAILLPTDTSFHVEDHWAEVYGEKPMAPAGWPELGRASREMFWFIDVTQDGLVAANPTLLTQRLHERIEQIAASLAGTTVVRRRAKHLVALPLLGSGAGGQRWQTMVAALLDALTELARQHELDFAIVVPERHTFEALQRHRRSRLEMPATSDEDGTDACRLTDVTRELGRRAREGSLSLMIGAGVSMGAGLPGWHALLEQVAHEVSEPERGALIIAPPAERTEKTSLAKAFTDLAAVDQAQLLEALLGTDLGRHVVRSIATKPNEKKRRPALGHLLLAGLQCRQVATTNYDDLYEAAVRSQSGGGIAKLPYQRPIHGQPWILKMHGDVEHADDIVLTRSSFVAYDGRHRPAGSLFQSMLMTSHVLFVGVSLTDDNILRLTHEVANYVTPTRPAGPTRRRAEDEEARTLGTVLTLTPDAHRARLWAGHLDWHAAGTTSEDPAANARDLEITLDAIAMWAVSGAG